MNEEKLDASSKFLVNNSNELILSKEEEELNRKKNLLQKKIINGGYNKDQFIDFCTSRKPLADDLSLWTYQELIQVVNDFISYHKEEVLKRNQEKEGGIKKGQLNDRINEFNSSLSDKNITQKNITQIEGKKVEKSLLNGKNINIILKNPRVVETSIFKSNYIVYEVETETTQWKVERRYNDFIWLRDTLKKLYPRNFCPPLPGKKIGSRRFESDFVEKRMKLLSLFLNDIMQNELYKSSNVLLSFLSISDRELFEAKIKEYESMYAPSKLEEYKSLNGKLKLLDFTADDGYFLNVSNFLQLQVQLSEKLNYDLKYFYYNINSACMSLEEVANDFETFTHLNQKIEMKEEITKTYEELSIFFKNWKRVIFNQNEVINNYIRKFFKYISMENDAFQELIKEREKVKAECLIVNNKLLEKKEKLWKTMDINKWEIINFNSIDSYKLFQDKNYAFSRMCTKDNDVAREAYNNLCFFNYMLNDQLRMLIKINCKRFIDNINEFAKEFYISLNDSLNTWSELGSFVEK